jgi:hypothetical protein
MKIPLFHRVSLNFMACMVLVASTISGCSLFSPHYEDITVYSSEPGAEIFINGELIGKGVGTRSVPRDKDITVMAKLPGYNPAVEQIRTRFSTTGAIDMVGGLVFLLPFLGALSPGFWQHEQTQISLAMTKE